MTKRKLNCVADLTNLRIQTADIVVCRIGSFGGEKLLDIGSHNLFQRDSAT